MNLQDFALLKEDGDHYTIAHPKGKSLKVAKRGLSDKAQKLISGLKKEQHFDDGGEVAPAAESVEDSPDQIALDAANQAPVPGISAAQEAAAIPQAAPAQAAPVSPAPDSSPVADISGILKKETADIGAGVQAEKKAGEESAKAYDAFAAASPDLTNVKLPSVQDIYNKHQSADQALQKAFADKTIDPDRYLKNMGTGSKIAAGIGMILGGVGAGLTGQPNAAVQSINNAIERDIEAQKSDQSKAMNLWKMNREATQDDVQATLATQNQMLNVVKAKTMAAAARAQGPLAQQRAAGMVSQIDQQLAQNNQIRSALSSSTQGGFSEADPSTLVPYLVPKELQPKVYEEIGRAQNVGVNSQKILKSFDQSVKENTVSKTGAGMLRTPGSVMALHQLLLPNFKQIDGTVRQAAMDETFHNVTPSPGDSEAKIAAKRQALLDWMHSETAAPVAKGSHIDLSRFKSTSADPRSRFTPQERQFYSWAIKTPNDPKAQLTLQKLGVQ